LNKNLSLQVQQNFLQTLKTRFEANMNRHEGLDWADIKAKLEANPEKLWSLNEMERTGGEPEVVGQDQETGEIIFFDCSPKSPEGRRSLCYDDEALEARKKNKPDGSAMGMAAQMGIELLDETQCRELQKFGEVDTKTSIWLKTPPDIRELGGAIYGDQRYGTVWKYHNGADSYYASGGFRASLWV
jgi:hypothetical protein